MKLQQLQEARLRAPLSGLYQVYDALEIHGDFEVLTEETFKVESNNQRTMDLLAQLVSDEFAGLFDGDFYGKPPNYVNLPSYHRLMRNHTIIQCGGDWGEGGDWYYAFNADPEQVYRVLENLIRGMPAKRFEQEIYDEKTEENVQEVLSAYRKNLKL